MANKIWVEVTLISARGLRRSSSSLWKRHWFAVGWIDPNDKYCTTVSKDGNPNPTWRTKFSALVERSSFEDKALTVEVYSREPVFLRETLEGTATILLKEFVLKYYGGEKKTCEEEVGSYQLRKRSSSRSHGVVDVSIRVAEEGGRGSDSYHGSGEDEGIVLKDHGTNPGQMPPPLAPFRQPQNPPSSFEYAYQVPYPANNHPSSSAAGGPSNYLPTSEPALGNYRGSMPSLPANVGYLPSFVPNLGYVNLPAAAGRSSSRPTAGNLAMGAGVGGALAGGAAIYGDDFVSALRIPSQTLQDPGLTMSLDSLF